MQKNLETHGNICLKKISFFFFWEHTASFHPSLLSLNVGSTLDNYLFLCHIQLSAIFAMWTILSDSLTKWTALPAAAMFCTQSTHYRKAPNLQYSVAIHPWTESLGVWVGGHSGLIVNQGSSGGHHAGRTLARSVRRPLSSCRHCAASEDEHHTYLLFISYVS